MKRREIVVEQAEPWGPIVARATTAEERLAAGVAAASDRRSRSTNRWSRSRDATRSSRRAARWRRDAAAGRRGAVDGWRRHAAGAARSS